METHEPSPELSLVEPPNTSEPAPSVATSTPGEVEARPRARKPKPEAAAGAESETSAEHELASDDGGSSADPAGEKPEEAKLENPLLEKKRIEEQLEALKRRESELRRALATASHPELADAIRLIEGRAYALSRVELKMAEGLSKSEERRKQTVEKKRAALQEKRDELDAQIAVLDAELNGLGIERTQAFERERRGAMEQLLAALGAHGAELSAAGLEAGQLVPDIARWMPEIQGLAEELTSASKAVN